MRALIALFLLLFLSAQGLALTAAYPCGDDSDSEPAMAMHHAGGETTAHGDMPCCDDGDPAVDPQAELCQLTCAAGACSSATTLESSPLPRLVLAGVASPPVTPGPFAPSPPAGSPFRPPISG
ncbi:hypothetical protein [Microbulbifer yueqingensis]|uniref:Uncharacterized protein n=1 Tax=Microbulbifer yueqingensis TaxID=658219 RepID=A0A1G9BPX3_9GAMM|nr:hypothetical protein [Microbulbifer yueqingensis]SDK41204.1 hypothetical protein SAMN05216212_2315 [Microbulbifer yueqingensis]